MTIEKLCQLTPEELAKMSDNELVAQLGHYFKVTRPEQQPKNAKKGVTSLSKTNNYKTQNVVSRFEKMFANRPDLFNELKDEE